MSDVEILKQAAQLMRANAEAATAGPWTTSLVWSPDAVATSAIYSNAHPAGSAASEVVASARKGARGTGGIRDPRNARHIASWQPAVALTVAAWVDSHAMDLESAGGNRLSCDSPGDLDMALAVARAYIEAAAR